MASGNQRAHFDKEIIDEIPGVYQLQMIEDCFTAAYRFGFQGSEGRCYKLFLNYSVCMDNAENPKAECTLLKEDYMECLHHKKEFARRIAINQRLRELGGKIPEMNEEKKEEAHSSHH